jgi:hypothetical protein
MIELIIYILGFIYGFTLSIFILLSNDKINKYNEEQKKI